MKTAVSIPTLLFEEAERKARKLGVSRSKLYSQALEKLLKEDHDAEITAELNELYSEIDSSLDPVWKEYRARFIAKHSEW